MKKLTIIVGPSGSRKTHTVCDLAKNYSHPVTIPVFTFDFFSHEVINRDCSSNPETDLIIMEAGINSVRFLNRTIISYLNKGFMIDQKMKDKFHLHTDLIITFQSSKPILLPQYLDFAELIECNYQLI